MKIAIVGTESEGKTRFVEQVLFRALLRDENQSYGFEIYEENDKTAYRSGPGTTLYVATFSTAEQAAAWLKSPAVQP